MERQRARGGEGAKIGIVIGRCIPTADSLSLSVVSGR
jgi:hypothetical protein